MATFIDAVNRVLRVNSIIRGGDDDITAFSETQHASDISLSQIAIQDEIAEIASERLIPYEKTSATITLLTSTRSYALPAGFVRFFGIPSFYDATDGTRIYEFDGGEEILQHQDLLYKTTEGAPNYWYWDNTTTKKVAFYNVPNSTYNNRSLAYDYEASILVTNSTDTMPFHNSEENYSFDSMAARRFFFMKSNKDLGLLTSDATYNNAKSRLYAFLRHNNPSKFYGNTYG